MLDKKLQLKSGQRIRIIGNAPALELKAVQTDKLEAEAVLLFVTVELDLRANLHVLQVASKENRLVWLAYPKAKQLGTDLNRDRIRELANQNGLDPVRQIALDDVWSALRLKST